MFFHLETGLVGDIGAYPRPCCWLADDHIFFDYGCLLSISRSLTKDITNLLKQAAKTEDYIDGINQFGFLLALEAEDDGCRNLCIYDKNVQMIINLEVKHFPSLIEFLNV
jgi:hypothetical protein